MAKKSIKWDELNRAIIAATDIESIYKEIGCEITGHRPSSSGWLQCRALGREDNSPSAAINVSDDDLRGKYKDLGGTGESLSLYDALAKFGKFGTWKDVQKELATRANLLKKFPQEDQERAEDKLSFIEKWSKLVIRDFLKKYPQIHEDALRLAGARIARYPAKSPQPQYVIAWPVYGPSGFDGGIKNYVIQAANGGMIDKFQGPDRPPEPTKRMVLSPGSGLVGRNALQNWDKAEVIWKVEGLSDRDALQSLIPENLRETHLVVTNACGASESFLPVEIAPLFAGKRVGLIGDCDVPGQEGVGKWLSALGSLVESIKNVLPPYEIAPKDGKDIRNWIDDGLTYQDLLGFLEAADEMKREPSPPTIAVQAAGEPDAAQSPVTQDPKSIAADFAGLTPEQQCLKKLGIVVLGEVEGTQTIVAFSQSLAKMVEIKSIDRLKIENLIQGFGEKTVKAHVAMGAEPDPAKLSLSFIRQAIAAEGGKRRLTDHNQLGIGIWELNGRLLLVNSGEFAILNGHFERSSIPMLEGKLIDFGSGEQWFNFAEVENLLKDSESSEWCKAVFNESCDLFSRWDNWKIDDTPQLLSALVCVTFLQTVWDWRPQVGVIGGTNSGKTMLMEKTLQHLFGKLAIMCSKPTEAGIRQFIRHTAKIILIDEFEDDQHRQKILETFRASSRGSQMLRGTANQTGTQFGLKHLPWVSAVEIGLKRAPDRNRYIMLELKTVDKNKSTLRVPPPEELNLLGLKLMTVGMRYWRETKAMSAGLIQRGYGSVDRRVVESYSLPCAFLGCVLGLSVDSTADLMQSMFDKRDQAAQAESDEAILLQEIYEATVMMPHGVKATVSEMLGCDTFSEPGWRDSLQRAGIKPFVDELQNKRVFFVKPAIRKELLKGSDFFRQDIDQILIRIKGAKNSRQRMGGHNPRGISIPESEINKLLSGSTEPSTSTDTREV